MSRRGYGSEVYEESRERYPPRRSAGRVAEYEEIDIHERRRGGPAPEFLADDYGRGAAGQMVLREMKSENFDAPRPRRREREVEKDELVVKVGRDREEDRRRDRERPVAREVEREEIVYRPRERERERPMEREVDREEVVYRSRTRDLPPPQQITREREVFEYRPREPSPLPPPQIAREREVFEFRPRERERPREPSYEREEITIRRDEREKSRDRERDEIIIRRDERTREKSRERERDEIVIRRDERSRERPRRGGYEEEDITIRRQERDRPRRGGYEEEDITIKREEREKPRGRGYEEDDIIIRRGVGPRERTRENSFEREEITIRRDERERPREPDYQKEEIIIRREKPRESEPEPEPEPEPLPPPEPAVIRAPPIHQEIITHHRHIDHGFEVLAPAPAPLPPPRPRSPSPEPERSFEEIDIRRRGSRNGRRYDDEIIIDRETISGPRRAKAPAPAPTPAPEEPRRARARDDFDLDDEAEYYNRRVGERAYMGEAYNGFTKDWAIVDVPPGTKRVEMEGVGGAKEEVTWQRYNGVRRAQFVPEAGELEVYGGREKEREREREVVETRELVVDTRDRGRRFVAEKTKEDVMWTEITKDLVIKEAIEECGYGFEETEFFFYVMEYLRYEDVLKLVDLTEDIRRERKERIREIQWEREHMPLPPVERRRPLELDWDEERVFEREVVYEPPRGGRRYLR
ncbi:MAG: hypothetical protein FRX48_02168 [Lasallia pustulata]|uniref:DUF8035 domain-containing protein n=1 Tax=Lasallia pustulata TaxID=136370 RepID=A0A5M8PXM1_9LECA|nr:MAG: hypothetical protein FRX48_02168 [Lasallia pustulata]